MIAPRQFRTLPNTTRLVTSESAIRVVSYNILANKLAVHWNTYCPPRYLDWGYRMPRILAELEQYRADIVCLQEVESSFFDGELSDWINRHGYVGLYSGRHNTEVEGPDEGTALLYRASMFTAVGAETVKFAELAAAMSAVPGVCHAQTLERDDGAIFAMLEHIPTHKRVAVGCTHLYHHPFFPDVKAFQAHLLCHAMRDFIIQHVQGEAQETPVIMGGDFNSLWYKYKSDEFDEVPPGGKLLSGVYELLSSGMLECSHPHHPSSRNNDPFRPFSTAGLQLVSAHLAANGVEPPLTTKTARFAGCLDYIWLSQGHWTLTEVLELPYADDGAMDPGAVDFMPAPNKHFPSDHIAVGCTITFASS